MFTYIIIDDEILIRKGTLKKLEPMHEEITCIGEADNGQDGIKLIAETKPDFVILDMQMPVMNGMELLPYLASHYESMPLIVISGYKNFDYIKQAISARAVEYLLKPFSADMIQDCVKKVLNQLQQRSEIRQQLKLTEEQTEQVRYDYDISLIHNLIFGYRTLDPILTSHRLNYINTTHNLILLTFGYYENADDSKFSLWLEENGFGDMALYISGRDVQQPQGFLILFLPQQDPKLQKDLAKQIFRSFRTYLLSLELKPVVGFSSIHHSLSDLNTAYRECALALDQRPLAAPKNSVCFYQSELHPITINWEHTGEFLFRIEAGMTDAVSELSNDLFQYYESIPGCRLIDVKAHCRKLAGSCQQLITEYINSPASDTSEGSGSMERVSSHFFHITDLEAYYRQFFMNVAFMLKPYSVYNSDDVIENVKTYMQRNYQKDLTQDYIASLFYMNRSYLSSQFRKKTGEKFVDYLNDVRLEHAEELLQNPGQKMYQIAKAVGYDNEKYFFRIFRKRTGMTPDQYRKQISGEN